MIIFLEREQIDVNAYDTCVTNSIHFEIYALSWYLDITTNNSWCVLVLDNYKAVMPLPYRKKIGIRYVYQPFWSLQLGVFSSKKIDISIFIKEIEKHFSYAELRLNPGNSEFKLHSDFENKTKQVLKVSRHFSIDQFRKDRKKDLRKAAESNLIFKRTTSSVNLIKLYKESIGNRIQKLSASDYINLENLICACLSKEKGAIFEVYADKEVVATAFILLYENKATILASATDLQNRSNGANTFLLTQIIHYYKNQILEFDFGGSSIPSIASYFKSFGAETINYPFFKINNLPFPIKFLKR